MRLSSAKIAGGIIVIVGEFAFALAVGGYVFLVVAMPVNDATPDLQTFPWWRTAIGGFVRTLPLAFGFAAGAYVLNRVVLGSWLAYTPRDSLRLAAFAGGVVLAAAAAGALIFGLVKPVL